MISIPALLLSLLCHNGCTVDSFVLSSLPSPWPPLTHDSSRHRLYPSFHSSSQLALSSSSSVLSTSPFSSTSIKRRIVPSSVEVSIHDPIANGTFGGVYFAKNDATGQPLVAKSARAATTDDRAELNAKSYLEIEAYVNSKLCPLKGNNTDSQQIRQHVAPYLGECEINGTTYLLWEASGEYTLEDYIEMEDGWVQLAADLGLDGSSDSNGVTVDENNEDEQQMEIARQDLHNRLATEVLRQILEGLAYCHSCGIVHRDIKPANILVDPQSHTLRLIDFGSACCMSSWTENKLGYKGENKGPRSILYCAPEEFVNEKHPYAFDIYGAAITWMRVVLSEDGYSNEEDSAVLSAANSTVLGLGDEDELFKWRIDVRNFGHDLISWEEYATLHNSLPYGWDSLFGSSRHGIQALRLLSNMMSYSPSNRMSAAEALIGPYLNPDCDAESPPDLPPAMPFSVISHIQRWKKDRQVHDGECRLDDLFTKVVAVTLEWPFGLLLGQDEVKNKDSQGGVKVIDFLDGTSAEKAAGLKKGDYLLAIGSIDVESASIKHVQDLLDQWPPNKSLTMLVVRDND